MNDLCFSVGVVGATGAVGEELLKLLAAPERKFRIGELRLFASERSAGTIKRFKDKSIVVEKLSETAFEGLDLAFFAAGGKTAEKFAPFAKASGCLVLDKSSAFRFQTDVPLVIPEINPGALKKHEGIIASPNCSTAITLMALWPLNQRFGLKRYFAATYQSVSGTGREAMKELNLQIKASAAGKGIPTPHVYPYQIALNVIPQVDSFGADGYTGEETKMRQESRKVLDLPDLRVSATCVRVPVVRTHSVAVNAEFEKPVDLAAARAALAAFPGVELVDEPSKSVYPTPLAYSEKAKCGVGRLRLDSALDNGLALWVSGDNLWKGSALNSIQIAEHMIHEGLF